MRIWQRLPFCLEKFAKSAQSPRKSQFIAFFGVRGPKISTSFSFWGWKQPEIALLDQDILVVQEAQQVTITGYI